MPRTGTCRGKSPARPKQTCIPLPGAPNSAKRGRTKAVLPSSATLLPSPHPLGQRTKAETSGSCGLDTGKDGELHPRAKGPPQSIIKNQATQGQRGCPRGGDQMEPLPTHQTTPPARGKALVLPRVTTPSSRTMWLWSNWPSVRASARKLSLCESGQPSLSMCTATGSAWRPGSCRQPQHSSPKRPVGKTAPQMPTAG